MQEASALERTIFLILIRTPDVETALPTHERMPNTAQIEFAE